MTDEYETYIEQVLTEVPDADRDATAERMADADGKAELQRRKQ